MNDNKKKPNIFQRFSAWLAGMIGAWINRHTDTTEALKWCVGQVVDIRKDHQALEALTATTLEEYKGRITQLQGYQILLMRLVGLEHFPAGQMEHTQINKITGGSYNQEGLWKLVNSSTLAKAFTRLEQVDKTLAMQAGKSMRLATHQALIENTKEELGKKITTLQEEGVEAMKKLALEKAHKVDALVHIMGLELREDGFPHNVEAWRSRTRNQDAEAMMALEALLGVKPGFNEEGEFTGYDWGENAHELWNQQDGTHSSPSDLPHGLTPMLLALVMEYDLIIQGLKEAGLDLDIKTAEEEELQLPPDPEAPGEPLKP